MFINHIHHSTLIHLRQHFTFFFFFFSLDLIYADSAPHTLHALFLHLFSLSHRRAYLSLSSLIPSLIFKFSNSLFGELPLAAISPATLLFHRISPDPTLIIPSTLFIFPPKHLQFFHLRSVKVKIDLPCRLLLTYMSVM